MTPSPIQEIKRLYYRATEQTIERDLARAVAVLKMLPDEESRAQAAVYMDGLSQMRSEWLLARRRKIRQAGPPKTGRRTGSQRGKKKR